MSHTLKCMWRSFVSDIGNIAVCIGLSWCRFVWYRGNKIFAYKYARLIWYFRTRCSIPWTEVYVVHTSLHAHHRLVLSPCSVTLMHCLKLKYELHLPNTWLYAFALCQCSGKRKRSPVSKFDGELYIHLPDIWMQKLSQHVC